MRDEYGVRFAAATACQDTSLRAEDHRRLARTRTFASLLAAVAAAAIALVYASAASATTTRHLEPFSPLTGAASGVTLPKQYQSGIAIDEASGNVFVTDAEGGIVILGGEGGPPAGLSSPFVVEGTKFLQPGYVERSFLAYDNSASSPAKGTLYTYDHETETIERYERDNATERYVEVAAGGIHMPGCDGYSAGGGIDSAGDLYFGCAGLDKLYELSPAGVMLHEYDLAETPIARPSQVAVDSAGDLFVQADLGGLYKFPVNPGDEIEPSHYEEVTAHASGVAYEPQANEVIVGGEGKMEEYNATTLAKIGEFGAEALSYEYDGKDVSERTERVAVNLATHRVYTVLSIGERVLVFGPDVIEPTLRATAATNVTGTKATLNGSVNPEGVEVTECFFEYGETSTYGHTVPCEGLPVTNDESQPVSANITGLTPNRATYHYRLVAANANGTEESADKTLVTAGTVVTEAATGVSASAATLTGYVRPEGLQYSDCAFEYKLITEASYSEAPCAPTATEIEPDFAAHTVTAALDELEPDSTYQYRLRATNTEGARYGEVLRLTTNGPPQISEIRARDATERTVSLEAKVDPSGYTTSYRFEWGPTTAYGHVVPAEFEPALGAGHEASLVTANLTGLTGASTYHYRIVARNASGSTTSADQTLETVNSCGLPEGRCFELVSPRDAGPVALPGLFAGSIELHFQAASEAGKLAYVVETGFPNATKGAEVVYEATRGEDGWSSTQLSPAITAIDEGQSGSSASSELQVLSEDLSCGIVTSNQPLTSDSTTRLTDEAGGANLYRRNPDGSYTAITNLVPENLELEEGGVPSRFEVYGISSNCGTVLFGTQYRYPVGGSSGRFNLYEWDEGTLRSVGFVPGPSGEVGVEATASEGATANTVSANGSRIFFSATRQTSPNPEEVGKTGVFVREDGTTTRDLSLSETAIPDEGATFQAATKDGSRVFFTANAGLTDESSAEGIDLYEYDLESEKLTDLSIDAKGDAAVAGFIGASEDGSRVYFAARGQLIPETGSTYQENLAGQTYSVYGEENGKVTYLSPIYSEYPRVEEGRASDENEAISVLIGKQQTSRVSPNGRYLLFESGADVTGYNSGNGVREAYLYDADATVEPMICISCRQDGTPSVSPGYNRRLPYAESAEPAQTLVVRNGKPQVFFGSFDSLAPGASEGQASIYEWSHGQVFRIATEPEGLQHKVEQGLLEELTFFIGANADGTDLYFDTPQTLTWEDGDERPSIYDARIGGGFPEPAAPPVPCNATSEGACQVGSSQAGAPAPAVATMTFSGPGDVLPKTTKEQKKKQHKAKKKQHKARKKRRNKRDKAKRRSNGGKDSRGKRGAKNDRRAGQ
jgi:Tol biopolymer transport system component